MDSKDYSIFTESGRMALALYLKGLKKRTKRKRIIVPSLTCIGVIQSIYSSGFEPLYVDITRDLSMDFDQMAKLLDEDIAGVIFQGLYGVLDVPAQIINDCKRNKSSIIFDCAQTFVSTKNISGLLIDADFVFLSFQSNKPLQYGGGALGVSRLPYLDELEKPRGLFYIRMIVICFLSKLAFNNFMCKILINPLKYNFDSDRFEGALEDIRIYSLSARIKKKLIKRFNEHESINDKKQVFLNELRGVLRKNSKWTIPVEDKLVNSAHYLPVRVKNKSELLKKFPANLYEWPLSPLSPYLKEVKGFDPKKFPEASLAVSNLLGIRIPLNASSKKLASIKKLIENDLMKFIL